MKLTTAELEVLKLVCQEMTSKEISEKLKYKLYYVENIRVNLIKKIGCINSVGLVIYAIKNKIYEI